MQTYSAPAEIPLPEMNDFRTYGDRCDQYDADLAAWVKESTDKHPLSGKIVQKRYADGYARYMIAKVSGKVSLIHIDTLDGWRDPSFERTVTVAELNRLLASQEKLAKIFSGR